MQTASSLPPSPKTSLACTLPLPVPSSTAARHLPELLAGGKPDTLSSSSIARQRGLSRPAGQRPPAREAQSRCRSLEPDPGVLQGTLPAAGAASAWRVGMWSCRRRIVELGPCIPSRRPGTGLCSWDGAQAASLHPLRQHRPRKMGLLAEIISI